MGLPAGPNVNRTNERLKLLATWINNFSLAFAIAGFVAPLVSQSIPGNLHALVVFFWLSLAAIVHSAGQYVLEGIR
jgi:hypothetical protein